MKSIMLDDQVHENLKAYCADNNLNMRAFVNNLIAEKVGILEYNCEVDIRKSIEDYKEGKLNKPLLAEIIMSDMNCTAVNAYKIIGKLIE